MNPKEIYLDCLKAIGAGRFEETVLKIEALEKEIKSPVPLSTLPCFRAFCLFQIGKIKEAQKVYENVFGSLGGTSLLGAKAVPLVVEFMLYPVEVTFWKQILNIPLDGDIVFAAPPSQANSVG